MNRNNYSAHPVRSTRPHETGRTTTRRNALRLAVVGLLVNLLAPFAVADQPKNVTCTVGMIADVAREIGGERIVVENIIGEGIDPHLYRPTRADLGKLMKADLVLYNGLMLEGKMASALNKISKRKRVRAVADAVPKESLMVPEGEEGHADPHLWMDVSLWKQVSILIRNELTELDPSGSDYFADRCKTYVEKLEKLHAYATSAITGVPNQQRLLVTAHDAFQYMGRAYGFEVRGIQGISTESEAGIADVNALVDLLVSRNVQAIFVETSVSDKNVRALIEGAAARGHTVTIGGTLYSDAMGPAQTYEGTYIGMIDHNVTVIASALGGSVPEKGLNQKLNR